MWPVRAVARRFFRWIFSTGDLSHVVTRTYVVGPIRGVARRFFLWGPVTLTPVVGPIRAVACRFFPMRICPTPSPVDFSCGEPVTCIPVVKSEVVSSQWWRQSRVVPRRSLWFEASTPALNWLPSLWRKPVLIIIIIRRLYRNIRGSETFFAVQKSWVELWMLRPL